MLTTDVGDGCWWLMWMTYLCHRHQVTNTNLMIGFIGPWLALVIIVSISTSGQRWKYTSVRVRSCSRCSIILTKHGFAFAHVKYFTRNPYLCSFMFGQTRTNTSLRSIRVRARSFLAWVTGNMNKTLFWPLIDRKLSQFHWYGTNILATWTLSISKSIHVVDP